MFIRDAQNFEAHFISSNVDSLHMNLSSYLQVILKWLRPATNYLQSYSLLLIEWEER